MGKIMFMFPGQGAQYIGMGKAMYDGYEKAREIFDIASKATGLDIPALCFEENEKLNITEYTQIAMLTVEAAIYGVMEEKGLKCDYTAGLSLGEYGALIAAGVLSYEDAFKVVRQRGIFMQEAVPEGVGAMAAIMGLDPDGVKALCEGVAPNGEIQPANFNSPGQVVISGLSEYIDKAIEHAKEYKAKRIVKLNVSAPFHSQYMKAAAERLKEEFAKISWNEAKYDIIANVSAKPVKKSEDIRDSLYRQTFSPVLWEQSVIYMLDEEKVTDFYELGTGEVLAGLIKRCRKGTSVKSGGTPGTLEEIRTCLH